MLVAFSITPLGVGEGVGRHVADAPRIGLTLKADIRPAVTDALTSKIDAVERYLSEG